MHAEMLRFLAAAAESLDALAGGVPADKDPVTPYLPLVPVLLDAYLVGFLEDPDGVDSYSFREATDAERAWFDAYPGRGR
jgi:hypothetical protein